MPETEGSGKRGCFFYGCIAGSVLLVLLLAGLIAGIFYAKRMYKDFTRSQPVELPAPKLTPEQTRAVEQRIDDFRDKVVTHKPTEPLYLTADEINALIAINTDVETLKGKYHVEIDDDRLKAHVSLPMDQLGLPVFRGRYLNGIADLDVMVNNGIFRLIATNVTVNGRPIPETYMQTIRKQNLGKHFNSDPRAGAAIDRLQEIRVEDGKLIFVPKTESP